MELRGTKLAALEAANEDRVVRAVVACWRDGRIDATWADDVRVALPGGVAATGTATLATHAAAVREGLADRRVEVVATVAELDAVVVEFVLRGRHVGPVPDVATRPTGGSLAVRAVAVCVVRYGRIVEVRLYVDGPTGDANAGADGRY